jgi:hypothetical protein
MQDIDIHSVISGKKNVDLPMDRQYLYVMGSFHSIYGKDTKYGLMDVDQGAQIFKKPRTHLEILVARRVT